MRNLSLRVRLLLATAAIALVALGAADVAVYGTLRSYLYNQVDANLTSSQRAVEATVDNPGAVTGSSGPSSRALGGRGGSLGGDGSSQPGTGLSADAGRPPGGPGGFCAIGRESAPGMFIEVRTASGKIVTGIAGKEECPAFQPGSTAYSPSLPTTISGFQVSSSSGPTELAAYFTTSSTIASGPVFRVRASKLANGDILIVASPIASIASTLSQLRLAEILVSAGALLLVVLLGLWLVRAGLRPLRDVERTAEAISAGDLMHRVPNANRRTEVGHVATAFNVMLERIEELVNDLRASESRLRRFVSDASHELRTPLAAVSAYTQLFRQGAASRQEDLRRAMGGIERETGRMGRLVEDLLTLAKLDERRPLESESVELVGLAMESADIARTVDTDWPITFVAEDPVEVCGDHTALRQVVDNLLANVRSHTPPHTVATMTVRRVGGEAMLEVADNGPGFTEEDARQLFDRFFRADPSRARSTGGSGLGLAIVASIVEAHGGRVTATPRRGGGAVFRVMMPALDEVGLE